MFNKSRLKVARQRAELTMRELASRVGIEPRTVTGYEAGEYLPGDDVARKFALVLGFPLEFFTAGRSLHLPHRGRAFGHRQQSVYGTDCASS